MNQKGAIIPLIAVLLLVIVVCVAFVVDLGHVHNVKSELQRAVDAAALAAARHLPDPDQVDAVAIATAASNTVDREAVVVTAENVILGVWDKVNLTATPSDRFTPTTVNPNSVYVRATRSVVHAFFFFIESTEVTADAIALSEPINPVMPLAVVSCIPLDRIQSDPGTLPGADVCDIRYFSFSPDTQDSAAWTGLTFGNDVGDISDFLTDPANRRLFEQVIFGEGLDSTDGIENEPPKGRNDPTCQPNELDIQCGLGMIGNRALAPPSAFSGPAAAGAAGMDIPTQNGHWVPNSPEFDPLYGYGANGALPRWYNINTSASLQTDDHFTRLWSMDGTLLAGPGEDLAAFQERLRSWRATPTTAPPAPFNDGRMGELILEFGANDQLSVALLTRFGYTTSQQRRAFFDANPALANNIYFPDFYEIMERAGYPVVGVNNGSASRLMGDFLDNPEAVIPDTNTLNCGVNDPPLAGKTLKVQMPVIFAGFCEQWKALSNPSGQWDLVYVGLADFYVTRAWKSPGDYACGDTYVSIQNAACSTADFEVQPAADGTFSAVSNNQLSIEGLFTVPQVDEAAASSLVKTYLVE